MGLGSGLDWIQLSHRSEWYQGCCEFGRGYVLWMNSLCVSVCMCVCAPTVQNSTANNSVS